MVTIQRWLREMDGSTTMTVVVAKLIWMVAMRTYYSIN
jgi:hypothetical protein